MRFFGSPGGVPAASRGHAVERAAYTLHQAAEGAGHFLIRGHGGESSAKEHSGR
jgi:hypothetical protein